MVDIGARKRQMAGAGVRRGRMDVRLRFVSVPSVGFWFATGMCVSNGFKNYVKLERSVVERSGG